MDLSYLSHLLSHIKRPYLSYPNTPGLLNPGVILANLPVPLPIRTHVWTVGSGWDAAVQMETFSGRCQETKVAAQSLLITVMTELRWELLSLRVNSVTAPLSLLTSRLSHASSRWSRQQLISHPFSWSTARCSGTVLKNTLQNRNPSHTTLVPAVKVLHILYGTSLLTSLFCYVRVEVLSSTFQVLCIALPCFPTKVHLKMPVWHLPAVTPIIFPTVIPELPGMEYFDLILEVQFLFYLWCWKDCLYYLEPFFPHK